MNKKALAALLSSLISDLLPILLTIPHISGNPSSFPITPFLINFLSISQTITSLSLLSNKRKQPEPEDEPIIISPSKTTRFVHKTFTGIPKSPDSYNLYFNIKSSTFEWLSALLEPLLECRDPVNGPLNLPVEARLGIGLFRLATGSDYVEVSRRFNVSEPVARFCVNQLCRVLCTDFRFWVGFPSPNELGPVSESFDRLTGLPNCCGVIHCTRFFDLEEQVRQEPIATQIVVDSSSKILNIFAGYNVQNSNQLVLKSSSLYKDIESNNLLNNNQPIDIDNVSIPQYFIGDQGYPLLSWLMVPFDQPVVNSYQENFNYVHNLMMVSAYRTIDSLKNWGVLSKPIKDEIKTMVAYIGACSILHNALLMREDYSCLSAERDEYLRYSDSPKYHLEDTFLHSSNEQKAVEIRSTLATRAKRCLK